MREFYTQSGWKGSRYNKELSATEIAKLIRKEIRTKYPKMKTSIRTKYFAGGCSIDVEIKDCGYNPINPEWDYKCNRVSEIYTDEAKQLLKEIEAMGDKYRRSDCDGMIDYFDTNFWYSVQFDWHFKSDHAKIMREK